MDKYFVHFDGWIAVNANNEEEAYAKTNAYLSKSGLIDDGEKGEWYLGEAQL
jgi:flagellar basal body rod protein FlgF